MLGFAGIGAFTVRYRRSFLYLGLTILLGLAIALCTGSVRSAITWYAYLYGYPIPWIIRNYFYITFVEYQWSILALDSLLWGVLFYSPFSLIRGRLSVRGTGKPWSATDLVYLYLTVIMIFFMLQEPIFQQIPMI